MKEEKREPRPQEDWLRDTKPPVIQGFQKDGIAARQIHSAPIPQPPKEL